MSNNSPFEGVYKRLGANFDEYDGWVLPSDFGNLQAEAAAMQEGCAAFDLSSFGRISVKGNDASAAIGKLTGADGLEIEDSKWVSCKAIIAGRENCSIRIALIGQAYMVLIHSCDTSSVLEALNAVEAGDVKVLDETAKTGMMGLYGPGAFEAVGGILPFDMGDMLPGDARKFSLMMISVIMLRGSWTGSDGIELICPASAAPLAAGAIAKYHQRQNITPAGMKCLIEAMESGH